MIAEIGLNKPVEMFKLLIVLDDVCDNGKKMEPFRAVDILVIIHFHKLIGSRHSAFIDLFGHFLCKMGGHLAYITLKNSVVVIHKMIKLIAYGFLHF